MTTMNFIYANFHLYAYRGISIIDEIKEITWEMKNSLLRFLVICFNISIVAISIYNHANKSKINIYKQRKLEYVKLEYDCLK